jgi:hypothetical protein
MLPYFYYIDIQINNLYKEVAMKNLFKKSVIITLIFAFTLVGCYGSFSLTKKVYKFNGSVGNKFIQSGLLWVFLIIPVYSATTFIDIVVLNFIEFWTGRNPLVMNDGEFEKQIVKTEKSTYQITASKNQFEIKVIEGENKDKVAILRFNESEKAWYIVDDNNNRIKVAEYTGDNLSIIKLFLADGSTLNFGTNNKTF